MGVGREIFHKEIRKISLPPQHLILHPYKQINILILPLYYFTSPEYLLKITNRKTSKMNSNNLQTETVKYSDPVKVFR
jgi:hypothetical protein